MKGFIVEEKNKRLFYSESEIFQEPKLLGKILDPQRIQILVELNKEPMYASQLAKKLKIHEQKIYYHIKHLLNAGILDVVEKMEIRGTIAKKYKPKSLNFSVLLDKKAKPIDGLVSRKIDPVLDKFLYPFIQKGEFNAKIIVGNPDPHGQYKARARDGHYAVDLALFLGSFSIIPEEFPVELDVDVKDFNQNLFIVGGPATNLLANKINPALDVRFSDTRPFGLISSKTKKKYSDDAIGIVARLESPIEKNKFVIILAGISSVGTKSAIIALTRHYDMILKNFFSQKSWYAVVHGYDLNGDGKIDSVEVIE